MFVILRLTLSISIATTLLCQSLVAGIFQEGAGTQSGPEANVQARYEGAGFSFTQPLGFDVRENFNGQLYSAELRRDDTDDDEDYAAIRLLYAPNAAAQVTPEQFAEMMLGDVQAWAARESMLIESTMETRRSFLGAERVGKQLVMRQSFPVGTFDIFAAEWEGHLIGVLTKVSNSEKARMAKAIDVVLGSVTASTLTPESRRKTSLGRFFLELPVYLPESREEISGVQILRLGHPQGVLEISVPPDSDPGNLYLVDSQFEGKRNTEVEQAIKAAGGQYLRNRWPGVWAGEGILAGTRMDILNPAGELQHVYSYYIPVEGSAISFNFECTPETRDVMTSFLSEVVSDLTAPGMDSALRDVLGGRNLRQDHGLSFFYPGFLKLELEEGDKRRFVMTPPFPEHQLDFQILLDLHDAPLGEGEFEKELRAIVEQYYPTAEFGESWGIGGSVFGVEQEGLSIAFSFDGDDFQINALPSPHKSGELITAVISCSTDANAALWIFANLHGGLTDLDDGLRYVSSKDARLTFDPADWSLDLTSTAFGSEFKFETRDGLTRVRVDVEGWSDCLPTDTFFSLAARAKRNFKTRRASFPIEIGKSFSQPDDLLHSESTTTTMVGGAFAVRNTILAGAEGEDEYEFTTWTARLNEAAVLVRSSSIADDAEAKQAIAALLDSLVLQGIKEYPDELAVFDGLQIAVPVGFLWDIKDGEERFLEISDPFDDSRFMEVYFTESFVEEDVQSLKAGVEAMLGSTGELKVSTGATLFLGEQVDLHRFSTHDEEGNFIDLYWAIMDIVQDRFFQIMITMHEDAEANGELDVFLKMLSTATYTK